MKLPNSEVIANLCQIGIEAVETNVGMLRIETGFGAIVFYTALDKWLYHGRVGKGDIHELKVWMKRKHLL